ncbi:MAG: DUF72 domain-containing protein [Planctomycetes bacterium]|nr:DUF72 domain-containing protein [Planctomycetota bacterium]
MENLKIGTCSWKYPSWEGLVYSRPSGINYLKEYAQNYNTVEIDQWFYALPDSATVRQYVSSVPDNFTFSIKAPSAITLTHTRQKQRDQLLRANKDFLSIPLLYSFLKLLEPMRNQIDVIMFEFEYLNKQKMPSLESFLEQLDVFFSQVPSGFSYALETRNSNYLKDTYFKFLNSNNIYHVFSEKIYMPPITEVYEKFKNNITHKTVIRLLGGDRRAIEKKTHERWDQIVEPKEEDLYKISRMIQKLICGNTAVTLNINNHYEGSAPLTIDKLNRLLSSV